MATRTVVCPECAEPLPYGRLACPSCGALLASVAGAGRRSDASSVGTIDEEPLLVPDDLPTPADLAAPATEAPATEPTRPVELPPVDGHPVEPYSPEPFEAGVVTAGAPAASPTIEPASPAWPEPASPAWPEPAAIPPVLHEWTGPGGPDELDLDPSADAPEVTAADPGAEPDEPYVPAGAYMPPSAVFAPDASVTASADPASAAPASAAPASTAPTSAAPASSAPTSAKPRRPGDAPLLADLPLDAPDSLPGWLVAAGAAVGTTGFFLPWAHRVIGASGDGYLSAWGFGALMNVPIFIAVFTTLVLAVTPNRVPGWLRTGVLPLIVGGLLLGTVWPYVLYGPLNGRLGSVIEVFAGLLLAIGGALALRASRHAGPPSSV